VKITVFGSTGGTGLEILHQALDRGHQVVAYARDPSKIAIANPRLAVVQGDILNEEQVLQAASGVDAAISALGVRLGEPPRTVRSEGTGNIVRALAALKVHRLVSVSTIGVSETIPRLSWVGRFLLPRIIGAERLREAERQEELIRQSDLDWTILRPPRLVNDEGRGHYRIGANLHTGMNSKISRSDLARALLDQLESSEFLRRCPSVIA